MVALYGSDVTLNCSFNHTTPFNLSDVSVFWQLTDTKRSVHGYWKEQDQLVDQAEAFANRTSLFPPQLGMGNASLWLSRVLVADEGSYTCFVRVQDYGSASLVLQVAGESTCDIHGTCKTNTHFNVEFVFSDSRQISMFDSVWTVPNTGSIRLVGHSQGSLKMILGLFKTLIDTGNYRFDFK